MTELLHPRASIFTLPFDLNNRLRYSPVWSFPDTATAADVYDAALALREGMTRPRSRFKIHGLGRDGYTRILQWLSGCGYDTDTLRLRTKPLSSGHA